MSRESLRALLSANSFFIIPLTNLKLKHMDLATVLEIKSRIEIAESYAQEDNQEGFECETNREYRAFVKGQCVALESILNHLEHFIEGELHGEENRTEQ